MIDSLIGPLLQVNVTDGSVIIPPLPPLTLTNLFGDLASVSILLVLTIAVTVRQSSEFIAKWLNNEVEFFNRKYIVYGILAFITSLPIGIGLFGEAAKMFMVYYGTWGFIGGLVMVAVYGYGWQHATNKVASLVGYFSTPKEVIAQKRAANKERLEQEKQAAAASKKEEKDHRDQQSFNSNG